MREASGAGILKAIYDVDSWSKQDGNRLYFYFSGHGFANPQMYTLDDDVLVPPEFELGSRPALSLASIQKYLIATRFSEQFFVLDCCRNLPPEDSEPLGPRAKDMPSGSKSAEQYVCSATLPGQVALGARGHLTDAILEGLGGAGRAKRWDQGARAYVVTADSLFDHIRERFGEQLILLGDGIVQEPQWYWSGKSDPQLVSFPDGFFGEGDLEVQIFPDPSEINPKVQIIGDGFFIELPRALTNPVVFNLPPRLYMVIATAQGYYPVSKVVHLYDLPYPRLSLVLARSFEMINVGEVVVEDLLGSSLVSTPSSAKGASRGLAGGTADRWMHPLHNGRPPIWASEWGQDRLHGPWCSLRVGGAVQRLRWISPGTFWMGSPEDEEGALGRRRTAASGHDRIRFLDL